MPTTYIVHTDAQAVAHEEWRVTLDETPAPDFLHDAILEALSGGEGGDAEYIGQEVDGEESREIRSIEPEERLEENREPAPLAPLVTVLGGVAETFHGDVTVIDFDDWNEDDEERRQEIIREVQAAGYRCVVSDGTRGVPDIQLFAPDAPYDQYVNELPDRAGFTVYDPEPTS